jgi:hypothetical protein
VQRRWNCPSIIIEMCGVPRVAVSDARRHLGVRSSDALPLDPHETRCSAMCLSAGFFLFEFCLGGACCTHEATEPPRHQENHPIEISDTSLTFLCLCAQCCKALHPSLGATISVFEISNFRSQILNLQSRSFPRFLPFALPRFVFLGFLSCFLAFVLS